MTHGEKVATRLVTTDVGWSSCLPTAFQLLVCGVHVQTHYDKNDAFKLADRIRTVIAREIDAARKDAVAKERYRVWRKEQGLDKQSREAMRKRRAKIGMKEVANA